MDQKKIHEHNLFQKLYYESALDKPAMQVRDSPYVLNHVERMIQHGNLNLNQTILEVGAGLGKFSIPMLQRGLNLTCNDLSAIQLLKLQSYVARPLNTVACDIIKIADFTEIKFDHVVGFFTLHHMIDLQAVFYGIRKVLQPGAKISFIEPMGRNPLYYIQIALTPGMSMRAERGILNMSDRFVHQAMLDAGLEPMKSVSYGFMPPFVVNRKWGGKIEKHLDQHSGLSWAHAFLMFRARNPR